MCGVIVVDAGRSRSTCLGRDAYMYDHCLRYRHDFTRFYQLLDSNLFTHRDICKVRSEGGKCDEVKEQG